jgi:SH3 domain protein
VPRLALLLLLGFAVNSFAEETFYIRDLLTVKLRADAGDDSAVVHSGIGSGTPVTVLERSGDKVKIRTDRGIEGWLPAVYLLQEPIARDQLKEARAEISRLRSLLDNNEAARAIKGLEKENAALKSSVEQLSNVSDQAQQLRADNGELSRENRALKDEVDRLQREVEALQGESRQQYFREGAFAVVIGVLIALIVPWLKPRKKRSEWA